MRDHEESGDVFVFVPDHLHVEEHAFELAGDKDNVVSLQLFLPGFSYGIEFTGLRQHRVPRGRELVGG